MEETILVVDDEKEIADLIEVYLENDGYRVKKFYNATDALACLEHTRIDLALLDIMLPDMDGFTLCQKIRTHLFFPIIMLTAKCEDADKIKGMTLGADDYITKPFNPLEVIARVRAQLRRTKKYNQAQNKMEQESRYEYNGLEIDEKTHSCTLFGKEVPLTPLEFSIVLYLFQNRGKVVSSEALFEAVWNEKYMDSNNTVMAHIAHIREKLGENSRKPNYIKTVWGVGYRIDE